MADSKTPAEAACASGGELGLEAIVDGSPLGGRHAVILLICALVAAVDGFDTQSVALVAPAVSAAWHVDPSHFGMVFAAGLFGSLLGALAFGVIGDRYGRRPALLTAVGWFALVTLTTTLTSSLPSMAVARFFTGLGLGGALPGIISLASEYAPLRQRSTLVSVMFCGFPLGAVIGGIASAAIIPAWGWQGMFYVSGGVTLLLLPVFAGLLPESIRFLAVKQDRAGIVRVLERMGWRQLWNGEVTAATPAQHSPVAKLFKDGRAPGTILLWVTLFLSLLLTYFLVNWIPLLARKNGVGMTAAVLAVATLNGGAIVGCLGIGRLSDRFGRVTRNISVGFALGALAIALIGTSGHSSALLLGATFLAGSLSIGAQMCTVAYCASFYETSLRATGVGWAIGIGRIGSIIGPLMGGALIASGVAVQSLFIVVGVMSLGSAAAIFTLGRLGIGQPVTVPRA